MFIGSGEVTFFLRSLAGMFFDHFGAEAGMLGAAAMAFVDCLGENLEEG